MPQLDIIYTLPIYMWTWLFITLISQKMGLFTLTIKPNKPRPSAGQLKTLTLQWT